MPLARLIDDVRALAQLEHLHVPAVADLLEGAFELDEHRHAEVTHRVATCAWTLFGGPPRYAAGRLVLEYHSQSPPRGLGSLSLELGEPVSLRALTAAFAGSQSGWYVPSPHAGPDAHRGWMIRGPRAEVWFTVDGRAHKVLGVAIRPPRESTLAVSPELAATSPYRVGSPRLAETRDALSALGTTMPAFAADQLLVLAALEPDGAHFGVAARRFLDALVSGHLAHPGQMWRFTLAALAAGDDATARSIAATRDEQWLVSRPIAEQLLAMQPQPHGRRQAHAESHRCWSMALRALVVLERARGANDAPRHFARAYGDAIAQLRQPELGPFLDELRASVPVLACVAAGDRAGFEQACAGWAEARDRAWHMLGSRSPLRSTSFELDGLRRLVGG